MTGYAIVLASEELEKLTAVSTIGSIAAASDIPVEVFVTMNALTAFEHETVETESWEHGRVGEGLLHNEDVDVPLFTEQLARAKEMGPLTVYACSMAMEVTGRTMADYVDVFDEELGVSGFLNRAADKQVVFV